MNATFIFGISGKAGSGKDTVASMISRIFLDEVITPSMRTMNAGKVVLCNHRFADPVKAIVSIKFGIPRENLESASFKESVIPGVTPETTVRKALQMEGTENGRLLYGEDLWVNALDKRIKEKEEQHPGSLIIWVVPDCRFENEAHYIYEKMEGAVILVERPDQTLIKESSHSSEAGIPENLITHTILNDGTLEELELKVRSGLSSFLHFIQRELGI